MEHIDGSRLRFCFCSEEVHGLQSEVRDTAICPQMHGKVMGIEAGVIPVWHPKKLHEIDPVECHTEMLEAICSEFDNWSTGHRNHVNVKITND